MNRINTVNVTQHVFEEDVRYVNLYLLNSVCVKTHQRLIDAESGRGNTNTDPGIILKITRTTEGDFLMEKVKEYP